MLPPTGDRKYFLPRKTDYLFSFDLALDTRTLQSQASPWLGGVRMHLTINGGDSPAYHVLGDETVLGNDSIFGCVRSFSDSVFVPEGTTTGRIDARISVETNDHAIIWAQYHGTLRLGPRGLDRLLEGNASFQAKAFITPRFETVFPKYRWLAERQCVGYGTVAVEKGVITSATFDIHAASAPLT
jgi:hypothetical protein